MKTNKNASATRNALSTDPIYYTPGIITKMILVFTVVLFGVASAIGQSADWKLEKMPSDLETDFALSALPPHLRSDASVYLLDPQKGYYLARKGTNGFICFVLRTEWERGQYRQDLVSPISYDTEGAKVLFQVYRDVAVLRASGISAVTLKDTIDARFKKGFYKSPKPGISYMLSPLARTYDDSGTVVTKSEPHYMFYAPYLKAIDLGCSPKAADGGPMMVGEGSPHGYGILFAGEKEKAKIVESHAQLLKRLSDYKPYLLIGRRS